MRGGLSALVLATVVLLAADVPSGAERNRPPLQADAVAGILAHGPWPISPRRDASNRASGNAAAIAFGRRMFHEPRLSANGYVSCVACHQTDRGWTDAIARARGLAPVGRNTPTLTNAALNTWFGWSGASDSLWMASLRPMLDEREMGSNSAAVAHVVRIGDGLACEYRHAFGRAPDDVGDETLMVDVAKAIAAFLETLSTGRTPFDRYRDALASGEVQRSGRYPAAAARGLRLFVGRAGCANCHSGPNFTDGRFHVATPVGPDAGRPSAIASLRESRYNLGSEFNDDPAQTAERVAGSGALAATKNAPGTVQVPSL